MEVETKKLKDHPLNIDLFKDTRGYDFDALKDDIKKNGIKTELHITEDFVVLCGHQRLKVAKELHLESVPCKIIKGLDTKEQQEEYIIKDNLLRRHLTTEQRYTLFARLSEIYEVGQGHRSDLQPDAKVASGSVLEKTAKETGESSRTIARARAYVKAIEKNPELKDKSVREIAESTKKKEPEPTERPIKITKRYDEKEDTLYVSNGRSPSRIQKLGDFTIGLDKDHIVVSIEAKDIYQTLKEMKI